MNKKSNNKVLTSKNAVANTNIHSAARKLLSTTNEKLASLYDRWQDEKEHEDFNEYVEAVKKMYNKKDVEVIKVTKKPFVVHIKIKGLTYEFKVTASKVELIYPKVEAPSTTTAPKAEAPKPSASNVKKTEYRCPKCGENDDITDTGKNGKQGKIFFCMTCEHEAPALRFLPKAQPKSTKKKAAAKAKAPKGAKTSKAADSTPKTKKVTVASTIRDLVRKGLDNKDILTEARKILGEDKVKDWYPAWYRNEMVRKGIQ